MRIAMVIDAWNHPFNGTVVSTRRFVAALRERGHDVHLLVVDEAEAARDSLATTFPRVSIPGLNPVFEKMRVPLAWPRRADLDAVLASSDLLHVQFPFFLGRGAISAARRARVPIVSSFHVQPENILLNLGLGVDGAVGRGLARAIYGVFVAGFYNASDRVIAPSEFARETLLAHGTRRPIQVVSNGVLPRFLEVPPRCADEDDRLRILSVGRMAPEKQQDVLLEAIAGSRFRDRVRLDLVGTGPREIELREHAARLGLDAEIGPVSDDELLERYARADLFVHAGRIELEGMSVLEAMAASRPVIVSDASTSAAASLVDLERRFRSGDPVDLRRRIDHWLEDAGARMLEGEANRRRAAQLHHGLCVDALESVYRELVPRSC